MPDSNGNKTTNEWLRHIDTKFDRHTLWMEDKLTGIEDKIDTKSDREQLEKTDLRVRSLEKNQTRILTGFSLAWVAVTSWLGFK